jgi:hypothetical protein
VLRGAILRSFIRKNEVPPPDNINLINYLISQGAVVEGVVQSFSSLVYTLVYTINKLFAVIIKLAGIKRYINDLALVQKTTNGPVLIHRRTDLWASPVDPVASMN